MRSLLYPTMTSEYVLLPGVPAFAELLAALRGMWVTTDENIVYLGIATCARYIFSLHP